MDQAFNWILTNAKTPLKFLVQMAVALPWIVIIVLFLESRGMMLTPTLVHLESAANRHDAMLLDHTALSKSMVQINEIAADYYSLLEKHSVESSRKNQIIEYFVLESCERNYSNNPEKCKRLKATIYNAGKR